MSNPHVLCRRGEKLSSEKCRILKLLGVQMAVSTRGGDPSLMEQEFRIYLGSRWSRDAGFVEGADLAALVGKDGMAVDQAS